MVVADFDMCSERFTSRDRRTRRVGNSSSFVVLRYE